MQLPMHKQTISSARGGILAQSKDSPFGDKVFLCLDGTRRWVRSISDVNRLGYRWPADVLQVDQGVLSAFRNAGAVPSILLDDPITPANINSSVLMRDFAGRVFTGLGLEVGAGASPYPVPLACKTLFADRFVYDDLVEHRYDGQNSQDLVRPDFIADLSNLDGLPDSFFNYIVGCHVIEHVWDPIGAIQSAYKKLRPGGYLLLVVPDKNKTFDRERSITSLSHLVDDFNIPSDDRDLGHYEDFYRLAFPVPESELEAVAQQKFQQRGDIHYHVWDFAAFSALIEYVVADVAPFTEVWSHPSLADESRDIEFYFRLKK